MEKASSGAGATLMKTKSSGAGATLMKTKSSGAGATLMETNSSGAGAGAGAMFMKEKGPGPELCHVYGDSADLWGRSRALEGLEIPHGQQQSHIFLLAPHHNGTN